MVSSADIYYEIDLPSIFMCDHPVGTVLGRAKYGNYFSFSQNCTIGNNKGLYPTLGDFVVMHANSMIIGNSVIGSNVIISANTYIKDQIIPSNSLVFNDNTKNNALIIKKLSQEKIHDLFEVRFKKYNEYDCNYYC
jgi:serine O-acetyltransferase